MKHVALIGGFFLSLSMLASTVAFADPRGEAQEQLGKAIQEMASQSTAQTGDKGAMQERLGLAIQAAASAGREATVASATGQEELGRLIRNTGFLNYTRGVLQEEMGTTILGMAQEAFQGRG